MLRASAAPHVLTVSFTVADVSARLVQLVPNAFVVRMDRALEAQTTEYTNAPLGAALRAVPVRVWAELGRARMPAGTSLDLPTGSVVELDREVEDPVDLYVDGLHFATGRLRVAEDGSLQLEVEQVLGLQRGAAVAELVAAEPERRRAATPAEPRAVADEPSSARPKRSHKLNLSPQQKARRCDMARVLVVDDAAFMRKMVSDVLLGGGHEVVGEAGDGVEAVERYQELRPEVTTLDITMPEKDGLSALREIIELDPAARVVMCSALGQESKVLESIKLGAKDFVVKPFQADRVLGAVEKALS